MNRKNDRNEEPTLYLNGDKPKIYRRRKIRWLSVLKWSALALVVVLIAVFIWGYIWLKTKESQMKIPGAEESLSDKREGQPVTTLVMGVDKGSVEGDESVARADILMLVSVDPDSGKAAVISIPRDTRCTIPGYEGYHKINAAYAFGGPTLQIETVKAFTGVDINHFVVMDFEGFKHIVDAIGGVPMHIDVAINDPYAGNVPAGDVNLDGEQALALVRARHDVNAVPAGDLDRIKNQRMFLQAMLSKVSGQRNPFKIKQLVDVASENIKTDLSFTEMLSLGRKLQGAGEESLNMATAPGTPKIIGGVWYYIVDMDAFNEMLAGFESESEVDPDNGEEQSETESEGRSEITIAVLNGAGVSRLAASVAEDLEEEGYTDVRTGNAASGYERTTVYYASGNSSKAGKVASDLNGVEEPYMEQSDELTGEYGVEVLVVLGSDYRRP